MAPSTAVVQRCRSVRLLAGDLIRHHPRVILHGDPTTDPPASAHRRPPDPPPAPTSAPVAPTVPDADLASRLATLAPRLRHAVAGDVRVDVGTRALYASDASNHRILPGAVVVPRSVEDVVATVQLAHEHRVPVTTRGAGTSIAGNAIGPGIVLDVSRHLNRLVDLDPVGATAIVEPGLVLDDLNRLAAPHRLRFGPDPSTHSRCTLGGMVGNNACGARSVQWGTTADNTLGLELVTAAGERRHVRSGDSAGLGPRLEGRLRALAFEHADLLRAELPPWPRRVSGYGLGWLLADHGFDVARALVGSEGTCAIVTRATVRLVRPPAVRSLLVLAFEDDVAAAAAVPSLLAETPLAVESLTADLFFDARELALELLPDGGAWLLVEAVGETPAEARDHAARLARAIDARPGDARSRLIEDARAQAVLWRVREDGAGRSARLADGSPAWPGFEDSAVPVERLAAYLAELRALLRDHGLRGTTYGHFGEGCLHLRIGFGLDRPGGVERYGRFLEAAADLVAAHGGTISGEHGDGRMRSALLPRMFSPAMLALFERFKATWDPDGILNPGIIVRPAPAVADLRRPRPTRLPVTPAFAYGHDGGDLRSAVERCIGVGRCVSRTGGALMCPSFRATGREEDSTRGRARLLQELLAGSLVTDGWRSTDVRDALDLCLSCKGCLSDCPTGVDMATLKSEFLQHHYRGRLRPRVHYSLGWLPTWLRLAEPVPWLVNAITGAPLIGRVARRLAGIASDRAIPRLARRSFRRIVRDVARTTAVRPGEPQRTGERTSAAGAPAAVAPGRVVLWPDTFHDHLAPEVPLAAVRVLDAAGFDVVVPDRAVCCGLTWITTGQLDRAAAVLRSTLAAPELAGDDPIVVLEPSCAASLRTDLVELLTDDPRARSVAGRVRTLAEVLVAPGISLPLRSPEPGASSAVIAQPHCHQQAVLGTDADRNVLARAGIEIGTMLSGCCGLAGNFGAEAGHEAISRAVAGLDLLPALDAAPDAPVLADGFSCRTQIAFLRDRPARHLAEVLAERLADG